MINPCSKSFYFPHGSLKLQYLNNTALVNNLATGKVPTKALHLLISSRITRVINQDTIKSYDPSTVKVFPAHF